jgi:hypothetical protein
MPACLAPIFSEQKKGGLKNPPESIHEMRVNIGSPLEEAICSCFAVESYLSEIFMFNKTILLDELISYTDK